MTKMHVVYFHTLTLQMSGSDTSRVIQPGDSSYYMRKLKNISSDKVTFEDTKPLIDEILQFLREVKDCGTRDVGGALHTLAKIPRCIMHEDVALDSIDTIQYNKVVSEVGQYLIHQDFSQICMRISNALHQALIECKAKSNYGAQCQYNLYRLCCILEGHSTSFHPA